MAGEGGDFSTVLAANGAVRPLARLLLKAVSYHEGVAGESAAATAAWALCNILWGAPSQVRTSLVA